MNRHWPSPATVTSLIAASAAAALVAGCSSSEGAGPVAGSSASGTATAKTTSGSPSPASGPALPSSASRALTSSAFYPVADGNTWVYRETDAEGTQTITTTMVSATPITDGQLVILRTDGGDLDHPGTGASTTSTMIFYSDGSITVPLTQLDIGVPIASGAIIWPSPAVLASGRPRHYTIAVGVRAAGMTLTADFHVTVRGGGPVSITVPAGTFHATLVDEILSADVAGAMVNAEVRTWMAKGTGPVQIESLTGVGSTAILVSTQKLASFTDRSGR